MGSGRAAILKSSLLNGWRLFWLIAVPLSLAMVFEASNTDLSTAPGVSHMIGYSVRWSVPFIYLVVAASALAFLYPAPFTIWLLKNRKFIGLCFAVAMAWQGLFIFIMSGLFRDYYFEEVYYFRDELEGSTGYIFLVAMVVTSFRFGRRFLTPQQWTLLHRSGVYFLWAYPFAVYWWNLFYYENPQAIDYVYYWTGFAAFALRILAWGKRRRTAALKATPGTTTPAVYRLLGAAIIVFGLYAAASGLAWQDTVSTFLTTPGWSANLELWLPFWPFEPFLSLMILGLGVMLITPSRKAEADFRARPADQA